MDTNKCRMKYPIILLCLSILGAGVRLGYGQSLASMQDPGHKEYSTVGEMKYSVPKGYSLEKTSNPRVAFMRHKKYALAIFVAVPDGDATDEYLTQLSATLTLQLAPNESGFKWKSIPGDSEGKVSKFQIGSGNTKGYNDKKLYQTDYITLQIKQKKVLAGYITELGEFNKSQKFLWNLKGVAGLSMPGWYAQAHVIASITGEKYEEINEGAVLTGSPVKIN